DPVDAAPAGDGARRPAGAGATGTGRAHPRDAAGRGALGGAVAANRRPSMAAPAAAPSMRDAGARPAQPRQPGPRQPPMERPPMIRRIPAGLAIVLLALPAAAAAQN